MYGRWPCKVCATRRDEPQPWPLESCKQRQFPAKDAALSSSASSSAPPMQRPALLTALFVPPRFLPLLGSSTRAPAWRAHERKVLHDLVEAIIHLFRFPHGGDKLCPMQALWADSRLDQLTCGTCDGSPEPH